MKILAFALHALSAIALILCGLLAWAGFDLEINMGSGSAAIASAWAFGIAAFGILSALALNFLGKVAASPSKGRSHILLFSTSSMSALFGGLLLLVSQNIFGTISYGLPIAVLAIVLPIFAYLFVRDVI